MTDSNHEATMRNIQIIDGADNATFSIFAATEAEFEAIFPGIDQDIELIEDFVSRTGESKGSDILAHLWERPVHKTCAKGIHGTLYYGFAKKRSFIPDSKREIDRPAEDLNPAQRSLYKTLTRSIQHPVRILVLNPGSSSIKFSLFEAQPATDPTSTLEGELSGIGQPTATLKIDGKSSPNPPANSPEAAIRAIFEALPAQIDAVGYRVVHPGPKLEDHQRITPEVLHDLEEAKTFAPLHDPEAVAVIREGLARFPAIPHFACFDTVFHRTMPDEATTYPIPEAIRNEGVHRYGFHGLSCESILPQLPRPLPKRLAIAHLGSGCSVTAVLEGRSVDTSMGLTPTGGVIMGTRPGDLDPGLILYLLRRGSNVDEVESMLNHESGLVALANLPNDMQAIRKASTPESVLALKIFTRAITKTIGAYAFLLGGLDAIVFTGGIGEHDSATRAQVLAGLEPFGIVIDPTLNLGKSPGPTPIHASHSATAVFVIPAQEDLTIAKHVARMAASPR